MKKTICLLCFALVVFSATSFASKIRRITLSELQSRAELIVLAEVTAVEAKGDMDQVTIQVDSFLKGKSAQRAYTFILVTRGGLKDFDPALKKGDSGVFFLKSRDRQGGVVKAYWGGVAIFTKNNFELTK